MRSAVLVVLFILLLPIASAISDIQSCGVTVTSELFYLAHDLSDADTCLTIQADNAIIDGNGSTIYYAGSSQGHAIIANGRDNITIRNLTIIQNSTITNSSSAIFMSANNSNIHDVTILTRGDSNNSGIYMESGDNITISGINVTTNGTGDKNSGIYKINLYRGRNITVKESYFSTKGVEANYGIYISNANYSLIKGNSISTNGTSRDNSGVYTHVSGYTVIRDNTIFARGSVASMGVEVRSGDEVLVENNTITTRGNTTANYGILVQSALLTRIIGNSIDSNGTASSSGVSFQQSFNSSLINNTIVTHGSNSGVVFFQSSYPTIGNETISTDGMTADLVFSSSTALAYNLTQGYLLAFYSNVGAIEFFENISGAGDKLFGTASVVNLASNAATVNVSLDANFNKSANVSLYGIGDLGFAVPAIFKGSVACEDCYNFTSLTASTVSFNVTSWNGTYFIADNGTEESEEESGTSSIQTTDSSSARSSTADSGYTSKRYNVGEDELREGASRSGLWRGDTIAFNVSGETHYLILNDFDVLVDGAWVEFTVRSDPQDFRLFEGESVEVDVTGDGTNDILIRLDEVIRNRVSLFVQDLSVIDDTPILPSSNNSPSDDANPEESHSILKGLLITLLILILLIGAVVGFSLKK